jgi:hypothetical protein
MKYIFLFIFTIILCGCEDSVEWKKETTDFSTSNSYPIQMLPGMKFTTVIYHWSTHGSLTGKLTESPDMGWLNMPISNFTSQGCSGIVPVYFDMIATDVIDTYSARIMDLNNHWSDLKLTMVVTNSPSENVTSYNISLNPGDSSVITIPAEYDGIDVSSWNNNCISNPYFPSSTQTINYEVYKKINWIKVEPLSVTLNQNETRDINFTIYYSNPGVYKVYIIKKVEWQRNPYYILLNVTMN